MTASKIFVINNSTIFIGVCHTVSFGISQRCKVGSEAKMDIMSYTYPYIPLHHYPLCLGLRPRSCCISCQQNIYFGCLICRLNRQKYHFHSIFQVLSCCWLVLEFTIRLLWTLLTLCNIPKSTSKIYANLHFYNDCVHSCIKSSTVWSFKQIPDLAWKTVRRITNAIFGWKS